MNTIIKQTLLILVLLGTLTLSAQQAKQRQNKFEIALGVNAVDVYLNNAYGLDAKTNESFFTDFFNTNDWNINSKAQDTYVDVGNKESSLPPISLRAAYYFSDQIALGMHFSANYLDIIDLCYNAVGLVQMVQQVQQVKVNHQILQDQVVLQVQMVLQVMQVPQVLVKLQVNLELQVLQVQVVLQELQVQVVKVQDLVLQDLQVQLVQMELQVQQELQV